ncbi:MAG TPA: hypothetical protein VIY49_03370 [Bryobacteraceae bacterium]
MATTPPTVSLRQLTATVNQAVQAALQRQKLTATAPFILNPGVLAGPILDVKTNIQVAQQLANEITAQVQAAQAGGAGAAATPLQSGVLITPNHIICGFFPAPPWELNVEQ